MDCFQVTLVGEVPLRAIWLRRQPKRVCSSSGHAFGDYISSAEFQKRLETVASLVQRLPRRLMPLLDNHNTSSLTYPPFCKRLNQGKKLCNALFSILNDEKTLQACRKVSHNGLRQSIQTRPHPEKECIISWWLMVSPPCGPSAFNHMNSLLVAFKRRRRNSDCVVPNVVCFVEITEIPMVIDVVCEVGKSLITPSNVI